MLVHSCMVAACTSVHNVIVSCAAQITSDNLCMAYNGYTQTPEYFRSLSCCRAVVPQSFAFNADAFLAWDVKHGNADNPWHLPCGKASSLIAGQLRQSGVNAVCDVAFHRAAFFKFCVNNAANLLAIVEDKCCRDMVRGAATVAFRLLLAFVGAYTAAARLSCGKGTVAVIMQPAPAK